MSRQVDYKTTKQVKIDAGLHKLVKTEASRQGKSIKALVEEVLVELLGVDYQSESRNE